jgi:hypothetical protein
MGLAWMGSRLVLGGLLQFPSDFDTLTYHLSLPVQWLQQGSLYAPDDAQWAVPGNNEVFGLWLIAPFSGAFLIALNNVPALVLLAVACVELGRLAGLEHPWSHLLAWAVLATTPVLRQMVDAENDVAVVSLFLASLCYGLRFLRWGTSGDVILTGVSAGLLAGVKYYALGYAAVAGTGLVLFTLIRRGREAAGRLVLFGLLGGLLFSGYWYGRNTWVTGTPLYPKGFTSSTDLQGQIRRDAWQTSLLGHRDPQVVPLLLQAIRRMDGPCQWLALRMLPFALAWVGGSCGWLWYHHGADRGASRGVLAFCTVAAGGIWATTPFLVETTPGTMDMLRGGSSPARFGLCFLSLALLCLVVLLHDAVLVLRSMVGVDLRTFMEYHLPRSLRPAALTLISSSPTLLFAVVLVYQLAEHLRPMSDKLATALVALNLLAFGSILVSAWRSWPRGRPLLGGALLTALMVLVAWLGPHWHAGFARHYDRRLQQELFTELEKMNPKITRICVLGYRYYRFFGSRHQFRVCRPLWVPTSSDFLAYLHDHDVTVVAAVRSDPNGMRRYAHARDWLRQHPEVFEPVQDGPHFIVCRVHRPALASTLTPR